MQTPSQTIPLELLPPDEESSQVAGASAANSVQKIIRFDLKEEGNHVLAVSVNYTEILMVPNKDAQSGYQASGGRVRTFRKLYQFIAQPCLSVRTKATELAPREIENRSLGPYGKTRLLRFALEAQLENVGDGVIVLGVGASVARTCIYSIFTLRKKIRLTMNRFQRLIQSLHSNRHR